MSIIHPEPCVPCSGGGTVSGRDVENLLLCDMVDGEVVGTALAVYEYDSATGLPSGAPTFVDPVTGVPYVPVGVLQRCPSISTGLTNSELRADPVIVDTQLDQALTLAQLLLQLPLLIDQVGGANFDKITATGTVTPGSPLVVAPPLGMSLRVWYILADYSPDDTVTGRVTATLVGKGQIYRCYGIGHRQRFDGDVDGTLTVACTDGTYEATVHYEEI